MRYSSLFSSAVMLGIAACSPEAATNAGSNDPTPATPSVASVAGGTWRLRAPYPTKLWDAKSASVTDPATGRSTLYVIGGRSNPRDHTNVFRAVRAYDPSADTWQSKAPFPIRIHSANGAVAINRRIYVPGGVSSFFDTERDRWRGVLRNTLYVYDPATNKWARRRDMPYNSASGVSDTYGGQLYVATFCNDAATCADGELLRYNPSTNAWMSLGPTPHNPAYNGGGFVGGKFYLVDMDGRVDIYDVATNRWSTGPAAFTQPPYASCPPASATLRSKLYLVGCHLYDDASGRYPMLVFDPASGAWSQTAPTPFPASGHWWALSRVIVNGKPGLELVGGGLADNNAQFMP